MLVYIFYCITKNKFDKRQDQCLSFTDLNRRRFMMKYYMRILVLTVLYGCQCIISPCRADEPLHPRVGVVLSGGGAKGVAHIGALHVLEEAGIYPDYIVGTSMGAIVGGLYAIGYSPEQLDSLFRSQDWEWLLSDKPKRIYSTLVQQEDERRYFLSIPLIGKVSLQEPESLVKGQNISDMFAALTVGYHDTVDFKHLPIPFACIATNLTDGSEVVQSSGILPEAMRASMSIPGVFSPVRHDGKILVDGGLINNFPVDVALHMGADIVIGVDVQDNPREANKLEGISGILSQLIDNACKNKYEENLRQTDIYIKVNVEGYSAASFTQAAIDTLIRRGRLAAEHSHGKLLELAGELKRKRAGKAILPFPRPFFNLSTDYYITEIQFEGVGRKDRSRVIRKCNLEENSRASYGQIEQALAILRNELNYSEADFRLYREREGYRLVFRLAEKKATTLRFGARFDSEELASLLFKGSFYLPTRIPSELTVTGRLGQRFVGGVKYSFQPSLMRNINFRYTYRYYDIDFRHRGDKTFSTSYNHHNFQVDYSSVWFGNFSYQAGIAYELYHNTDILYRKDIPPLTTNLADNILKCFIRLDYNTQDYILFPTHGIKYTVSGTIYTDKIIHNNGYPPFYALAGSFSGACSLTHQLTLIPSFDMRLLKGNGIPMVYRNALGGEVPSRYLGQQLPFIGVNYVELARNVLLTAGMSIRYHIREKQYVSCIGNIAVNTDKFSRIGKEKILYGIGLNYTFGSLFGPFGITAGYSNLTKNFYYFANVGYYF